MNTGLLLLIITIATALIFDFLNGFHDAANSIATVVSTRVLSPKLAVVWAAFFNFVAAFVLGTAVAHTIGKGMIRLDDVTQYVVIAGLLGAIVWDLLTWWWGLPTSSSHALIGGYAGAAMARAALNHGIANAYGVILPQGWTKTLIFIVVAPVIGLVMALVFSIAGYWLLKNRTPSTVGWQLGTLSLLDHSRREWCDSRWYIFRWLAHCSHHGIKDHQAEALRWFLRRKCRRPDPVRYGAGGDSREHHAHHYWRNRWSGCGAPAVGCPMGSGPAHCVGLATDDSSISGSGGIGLLDCVDVQSRGVNECRTQK